MVRTDTPAPGAAVGVEVRLLLYVAGNAPNSASALRNLKAVLPDGSGSHRSVDLQVVDVLKDPGRAIAAGILISPTLVRISPLPVVRIVGNLSDHEKVRAVLGLGE